MANSEAGSSSDSVQASGGESQVFLNFRGPDTRHVFTDFLYHGLVDAGVRVFRDDEELRVGEVISENLLRAIDNSKIYIPIFSQTYASSKWCLRELAHIVKNVSKSESQKIILPIFLDVEPEDVKLKTPLYNNALLEHEKNFPVEVEKWRKALAEVDEIKGWNVKKDESQATIVKLVVERVLEKLKLKQRLVPEHLVGLDDRVKHLTELLDVNQRDVRLIGIYGMGGIGKTTVAKVVFNELLSHFGKCSSFHENVREKMSTEDGIVQLQKKLLSDIVDSRSVGGVQDVEEGMRRIGEVLSTKKVLVVLDDADNKDHIKRLIGNNSLHSGSRIIITTRNKAILQGQEFKDEIIPYEMLKMNDAPALELFCRHAFGKNFPSDGYHVLSSEIVLRTGGLPLAVEVIGSLLKGKDKAFWKETKIKLRNVPEEEIMKKLRISYDDLNEHQQQIFLDIACFFFNEKKTNAIDMWDHCEFYPNIGIHVLISRCLIKILDDDKFWMHDQLRDMGRRIVDQESPNDPGNRSRLLIGPKQALEIKRIKERKDKVEALQINGYGNLAITKEVFERFPNLRFLKLESVTFTGDFANCFSNVKCISMEGPLKAISMLDMRADNMYLEHLAVFKLANNCFEDDSKVWDLIKRAQALKVLSLSGCNGITRIPDFSECLSLKRLTLAYCQGLKRVESFIGKLQSLIELEIEECRGLTDLPEEVGALRNLQHFSLWGCSGLRELPSSLGNLTSLEELRLFRTRIRELPNSIKKLKSLRILHFAIRSSEDHAWHFPSGISMLVNLEELDLSGHKGMEGEIPIGIGALSYLRILNLACTSICKIPRTINKLHHLQTLDLSSCNKIQELPELPTSLTCLLFKSMSLRSIPNLSNLINLVELQLVGDFGTIAEGNLFTGRNLSWIGRLSRLEKLNLKLLSFSVHLELASLSHLKELVLECLDFKPLTQFPSSDWSGRNLSTLRLGSCGVRDIQLVELPRLEHFTVIYCGLLKVLSISSGLTQLRLVDVRGCDKLVEIRVESLSKSLEELIIESCDSLERINGLSCSKNLKSLVIWKCRVLTDVEGLDELESLKSLTVTGCESLRRFIDASCTKIPDYCTLTIAECGNSIKDSRGMRLKYYREEILRNSSNKDEAKRDVSSPDEDSNSASVDESETEGYGRGTVGCFSASVDESETEGYGRGTVGCFSSVKAIVRRRQMKDERIGHSRNVDGGKTTSMENRKEEKDKSGEPAGRCDIQSSWSRGEEVEHHESTCKATTEVEDEGDLFYSKCPFTIIFHLGVKKPSEWSHCFGGIERENKNVTPDSVTYKGLIADVKGFGFRLKRMWYERPGEYRNLPTEIKSDEQVKGMVQLASKRRSIHLYVEGGVDSEWEGEYDDEMMEMLREEWTMRTDEYSDEDEAEWGISGSDENSDTASMGESETDGTFSLNDSQSKLGDAECLEAMRNGRQMRDGRILHYGSVDGGKTVSVENRKEYKEELGEPANRNNVVRSSCQGIEHDEISNKATTKVEDHRDFSSVSTEDLHFINFAVLKKLAWDFNMVQVKRDRTVKNDQVIAKTSGGSGTRCASSPGRDLAERGKARGMTSTSRKSKASRPGRDTASTFGKGVASNSGRGIASSSRSSVTSSSGRGGNSSSKKGATLSSGRVTALSLQRGRGSCSRGTTEKGASPSSGRGIASSSRNSATMSRERGRLGKGPTSSSRMDTTLSLGRGATKMGTSSRSGTDRGSSSPRSSATLGTGRGRGSTSEKGATVSSGRTILSFGGGVAKMGTSLISGMDKGPSSAETESKTPRS